MRLRCRPHWDILSEWIRTNGGWWNILGQLVGIATALLDVFCFLLKELLRKKALRVNIYRSLWRRCRRPLLLAAWFSALLGFLLWRCIVLHTASPRLPATGEFMPFHLGWTCPQRQSACCSEQTALGES